MYLVYKLFNFKILLNLIFFHVYYNIPWIFFLSKFSIIWLKIYSMITLRLPSAVIIGGVNCYLTMHVVRFILTYNLETCNYWITTDSCHLNSIYSYLDECTLQVQLNSSTWQHYILRCCYFVHGSYWIFQTSLNNIFLSKYYLCSLLYVLGLISI